MLQFIAAGPGCTKGPFDHRECLNVDVSMEQPCPWHVGDSKYCAWLDLGLGRCPFPMAFLCPVWASPALGNAGVHAAWPYHVDLVLPLRLSLSIMSWPWLSITS